MEVATLYLMHKELTVRFKPTAASSRSLWDGLSVLVPELQVEADDRAYEPALRRLKIETLNLPTADRVRTVLLDETKKVRARADKERCDQWYKKKGGEKREELDQQPNLFTSPQCTPMGREAVQLLIAITTMSPLQRIRACDEMEERYPGTGFAYSKEEALKCLTPREHWQPLEDVPPRARFGILRDYAQKELELLAYQTGGEVPVPASTGRDSPTLPGLDDEYAVEETRTRPDPEFQTGLRS